MPILFCVISRETDILWKFATCDGNFNEIAELVLSKLPVTDNKKTYSHGIYLLHYIAKDKYFYLCITDKLCQRSRAFLFLNEIQRRFKASRRQPNKDFTEVLASEMYRYSEDYNTITIRKGELDEINSIGVGCSENLLGEKILYINNPDKISYSTVSYLRRSPERISVSRTCYLYVIIIGVVLLIIGLTMYILGPVSCTVIASLGIFSLVRYIVKPVDKSE